MSNPQRPPRQQAQQHHPQHQIRKETRKETTGLLVSVVRTLTTSATTEQREREKERLEQGYESTEKLIEALISANQGDLTLCLQSFCKISDRIVRARERIQNVKTNLSSCKLLLQCKKDELQNLWKESLEQKEVSRLLEMVEETKGVPYLVRESIGKRHFLKSSELLMSAETNLDNDLQTIAGLNSLRSELRRKKEELFDLILEELNKQLYLRPCEEVLLELRRGGSGRFRAGLAEQRSNDFLSPGDRASVASGLSNPMSAKSTSWGSGLLKFSENDTPILQDNGLAYEDLSDNSPEMRPLQYIAVLVESLATLQRIPDAVDKLQHNIAKGLLKIVHQTTAFLYDHAMIHEAQNPLKASDSRYLTELLQLLFREFKIVASLHGILIGQFQRVMANYKISTADVLTYAIEDVWQNIQTAVQQLLLTYWDVKSNGLPALAFDSPNNLTAYFAKKRPPKRRANLFRFDATTHAQNVHAYAKEQKMNAPMTLASPGDQPENTFICLPSPFNVVAAFKPLMKFIQEIETRHGLSPLETGNVGRPGTSKLHEFLKQHIDERFMPALHKEIDDRLLIALESSSITSWTHVIDLEEMKRLNAAVPLLVSTTKVVDVVKYVISLAAALSSFVEPLADLLLDILQEYRSMADTAYEKLTKSIKMQSNVSSMEIGLLNRPLGGEAAPSQQPIEYRKISATWAVDEDISRLLKSLENWTSLMADLAGGTQTPFSPPSLPTPMTEKPEAVRARNSRESEILIGNLGMQKKIEESEIIQDSAHLKAMANMHESLEWFCVNVRKLISGLPTNIIKKLKETIPVRATNAPSQSPIGSYHQCLQEDLEYLENMASVWLLMLHLEIRVHCFYYLLPMARETSHLLGVLHSQEISANVLSLNRNLVLLDELLKLNLQPRKVRYIFEGLGHLIASIFINCSQHIVKINDSGKKRMCRSIFSIQQCLANITSSRETDLDRAGRYYELLYKAPDEILNSILEKGPEFQELEYHYLLALSIRSDQVYSTEPGALEQRLSRLRDIMQERARSEASKQKR